MREIKFRAWDGELMHNVDTIEFTIGGVRWYGPGLEQGISSANTDSIWKIDSTLMQFIGLRDKNGKEIYEEDIISWLGFEVQNGKQIRPVRKREVMWVFLGLAQIQNLCDPDNNGTVEVIGNIYENPELLKEGV